MPSLASQSSGLPAATLTGAAEVWALVRGLAQASEAVEQRQAEICGLRPPLFRLLALAVAAGPEGVAVSRAAQVLGLRPQALNRPAGELEALGLLWREADPDDGRARRLRATPDGAARLEPARRLEEEALHRIAAAIPQASVARLVLRRLVEALAAA